MTPRNEPLRTLVGFFDTSRILSWTFKTTNTFLIVYCSNPPNVYNVLPALIRQTTSRATTAGTLANSAAVSDFIFTAHRFAHNHPQCHWHTTGTTATNLDLDSSPPNTSTVKRCVNTNKKSSSYSASALSLPEDRRRSSRCKLTLRVRDPPATSAPLVFDFLRCHDVSQGSLYLARVCAHAYDVACYAHTLSTS